MTWNRLTPLLGVLVAVCAANAAAQTGQKPAPLPPPASAPASPPASPPVAPPVAAPAVPAPEPDRTTASFGDWVLRCDRQADVSPPRRFCEMAQTIQRAGDAGPLAQVAVGRIASTEPFRITALFPNNVTFQPGPKLVAEGRDGQTIDLSWLRCLPAGCVSSAVVVEDVLKKLRAQKDAGRIEYRDGGGREVAIALSFRGFGEAFEALLRETSN